MKRIDMKATEEGFAAGIRSFCASVTAAVAELRTRMLAVRLVPAVEGPAPYGNIMALVAHLCDQDENLRIWLLRWLAYQLRNPGAKMSTALIFNGGRESGKGLFLKYVVAQLFHEDAPWIRAHQLHNVFNDWASDGGLVMVEGPMSNRHLERMKAYMAAGAMVIESKGRNPRTIPNTLNFIYLSHADDFLPMDLHCRRFVVLDVPPARQPAFYHAVLHEIACGGVESFRDFLLHHLDMRNFTSSTAAPAPRLVKAQEAA
jgi:hypothetical protein